VYFVALTLENLFFETLGNSIDIYIIQCFCFLVPDIANICPFGEIAHQIKDANKQEEDNYEY
jgi:hypothetical protein